VEAGADCIELDVQQTADGVLVVLHDENLRRTAGLDREVRDVTYDEIRGLSVGSWYSVRFSRERLPTLEETLRFLRDSGIRLNIELKCGGSDAKDAETAAAAAALIRKYGMRDRCLITSCDYEILKQVKRCDRGIATAYITDRFCPDCLTMDDADAFSLRADSVTPSVVRRLHAAGKAVHVWTVDSKREMREMLELGVDDLITDDPALALAQVSSYERDSALEVFGRTLWPAGPAVLPTPEP
jgi:glycerophosphoryl diester phosphodiesterase